MKTAREHKAGASARDPRDLSDAEWRRIAPLLLRPNLRGRPYRDPRGVLNGILWVLRTGAPWRALPLRYGSWQTAYSRYRCWQRDGRLHAILDRLDLELPAEQHESPIHVSTRPHLSEVDHGNRGRISAR